MGEEDEKAVDKEPREERRFLTTRLAEIHHDLQNAYDAMLEGLELFERGAVQALELATDEAESLACIEVVPAEPRWELKPESRAALRTIVGLLDSAASLRADLLTLRRYGWEP